MELQTFLHRRTKAGKVEINQIALYQIGVIEAELALNLQVWIKALSLEGNLNQAKEIRGRIIRVQEALML